MSSRLLANFVTTSYQKVSEMLSDSKISTLESGFKNFRICLRICRMRVDDSRIRKEKVADSKISGYGWTGPQRLFDRNVVPPHWLLASSLSFPLINSTLVVGRCDFGCL